MRNTLSSLFANVECRQLPWRWPSEAEAWVEAGLRGYRNKVAANGQMVLRGLNIAGGGNMFPTQRMVASPLANETRRISLNHLSAGD